MITLFTGSPGAGKTASMVEFLSKLPGDRPLFVDGLDGLTLPHTVVDASNWHNELPDGAILVIDEVQRVWRPRGPGSKVPDSVAQLETHRHRGIDVFITTQAPRLLDSNVRGLVGRHVHIRDTGILGRYWYEWPETSDAMNWKTCINKKRITLSKKAFALYQSASLHTKPVRGVPRALIFGIVALFLFAGLAYGVYKIIKRTQTPPVVVVSAVSAAGDSRPPAGPSFSPGARLIDDRVDFIPRVSAKPESAPAYDHLRVVVVMPVVKIGYCSGDSCRCLTDQGTDAGLSARDCAQFVANPPFDPYRVKPQAGRDSEGVRPAPAGVTPADVSRVSL